MNGQSQTHTKTLGTLGYIAPEFGSKGIISTKVDVYSFGIMLMEIFTRKKPDDDMFVEGLSLKSWISGSFPHAIIQVMDSNLLNGQERNSLHDIVKTTSSIFELALSCCADLPEGRISMIDAAASLNRIKVAFMQMPRQNVLK
ncbi:hypothetical protein L6164_037297 [Bauhinia variegata]|uniref:Uncharacterized protein n=1 Tax=Bauhinia variegata TaxID=167791 RepID=A0ACB9KJR5_BAUVA|nr:hypothetical protein L6164_037297 [Bauhinia variegata]